MARKNFGDTVGTTNVSLIAAGASPETITIRTINLCNRLTVDQDIVCNLWYIDADKSNKQIYLLRNVTIRARSMLTLDIGQVLESLDSLNAVSDTAASLDISGSYEV